VKLEWTYFAQADRAGIYDYIDLDNPQAAAALDERFRSAASRLAKFPKIGRPGRVEGTRELVVHKHYILLYDIEGETVRILRVLHTSRRWPAE